MSVAKDNKLKGERMNIILNLEERIKILEEHIERIDKVLDLIIKELAVIDLGLAIFNISKIVGAILATIIWYIKEKNVQSR